MWRLYLSWQMHAALALPPAAAHLGEGRAQRCNDNNVVVRAVAALIQRGVAGGAGLQQVGKEQGEGEQSSQKAPL